MQAATCGVLSVADILPAQAPPQESLADTITHLTEHAHEDLLNTLARFGNKIDRGTIGGRRHAGALRKVLETYSKLAIESTSGRIAFPLAVGVGKTQSIASWCGSVYALGLPRSVLVCQERVESLEDLYTDLQSKGIPADRIGLLHSKGDDARLPSCNLCDVEEFQFLLVTHSKIKTRRDTDTLNTFNGEVRSLCIWDESLIRNEGRSVLASEIEDGLSSALNKIKGRFADTDTRSDRDAWEAARYIEQSIDQLAKALHQGGTCEPVRLKERDAETLNGYRKALAGAMTGFRSKTSRAHLQELEQFLEISQEPLRLVSLGTGSSGDGAITYLPRVPKSLRRVVVLDASYQIRELAQLDDGMRLVDDYEDVKSFDAVSVTQAKEYGGRTSVERLRASSKVTMSVVQDVLDAPAKEGILIITYKTRGRRGPTEVLKEALEDAGVDLDETILVQVWNTETGRFNWTPRPRVVLIHWGMEKAISKYAYCKNMIAVGVLRRDRLDLSSNIVGQTEDHSSILADDRQYLDRVCVSEQFHRLQQFIGRGAAREIVNGQAKAAAVKVYDQSDFSPFIQTGLPGVEWKAEGRERTRRSGTKRENLAGHLRAYLRGFSEDRISTRALKIVVGMADVPKKTFQRALNESLFVDSGWCREGRSVVRKT